MTDIRIIDIVKRFCKKANPNYLLAFQNTDYLLKNAEINNSHRIAHFLAQVFHETDYLTITEESMNYVHTSRIAAVWPNRPEAKQYVGQPEKLGNCVYANRMGNGDFASGDGYKYRGRGILQTTGKEDYDKFGKRCGVDFVNNPDLICSAEHALKPAIYEWTDKGLNRYADENNIKVITLRINGGYVGYQERQQIFAQIYPIINKLLSDSNLVFSETTQNLPLPTIPDAPVKVNPLNTDTIKKIVVIGVTTGSITQIKTSNFFTDHITGLICAGFIFGLGIYALIKLTRK